MKNVLYTLLILLTLGFVACEESDMDKPWGNSLIYMPQSVLGDGGQTANLNIEISESASSDTSIVVGIYRSGLAPLEAVSVDLIVATDTLTTAIANGDLGVTGFEPFKGAKLLPSDYYSMPQQLALVDGERENTGMIVVDKTKLFSDSHSGKFILPVKLANPTNYELNESRSLTFFILSKK